MSKNKVHLNICGCEFSVHTQDDSEYMENLAKEVGYKINSITDSNEKISVTMAAIISSLDYCDMYKKSQESSASLRNQIRDYLEDAARARMEVDVAHREIERLNREIQQLRIQNAANAGQGKNR